MTFCLSLAGCLVTDKVEFERERNFPASIETRASSGSLPLNEVIIIDLDDEGALEGELEFPFVVRDPNVAQELTYLVFLDNDDNPTKGDMINPTDDRAEARNAMFTLQRSNFSAEGCRRIDLLVSEDFNFAMLEPRMPARNAQERDELRDLGTAHWWVFTRLGPEGQVNPSDCPEAGTME